MILFKNCCLFTPREKPKYVDILVKDSKIAKIGQNISETCETYDLKGKIVMPAFANCYHNSVRAVENSYGVTLEKSAKNLVKELILLKSLGAGVAFDEWEDSITFFENLDTLDEKAIDELALKSKGDNFIKFGQTLDELGSINKRFGQTPSVFLESFGLLDHKTARSYDTRAVIIGGNCLEKDDLMYLSAYDTPFVLLPNDDARFGRRFANINTLLSLDFLTGIGSGEYAEIDFFAYMRQILAYNSFVMENSTRITPVQVLEMATLNGAKILRKDGRVTEGNFANFIVLNSSNALYPSLAEEIVFGKSKRDVEITVKNGKIFTQNFKNSMENQTKYAKIVEDLKQIIRRK